MSKLFYWLILILVVGGLLGSYLRGRPARIGASIEEHRALLISRITEIADLAVLKVPVSTVITSELTGYIGGIRCVVVVNGEVELGVDIEQARIEDVDPKDRTATLVLPEPKVRHARLDHERTTVFSIDRDGLWCLSLSDDAVRALVNMAMREAQITIKTAADDPAHVEQARRRVGHIVQRAFKFIDWELAVIWDE